MTLPSNGITAEAIPEVTPPYQLSADLLAAMFAALPAPPADATMAWRQTRASRLVQAVAARMPADAVQARTATQIVTVHEAAADTLAMAFAPGLTVRQISALRRAGAALAAVGLGLERALVGRR